ncbi:MAG TPA: toxin TcdB middle/N-terminal domain-containing protein, partial [Polyangiaceae bacterium]|nr:toxin TcdB middle/N-terminal domain-containing protein [Polyangiaceae bacterium]
MSALAWFVACLTTLAGTARADRPAPLSAQTLKAPSGPSSLKGLGESFSANPGTGTGSYSVPITLPPGSVMPSIALRYTGGAGKGEVGVGFTLSPFQIYRMTDKGSPKFDESDRFAVSAPEYNDELVLANASLRIYRMKNEGPDVLFQRDPTNDRWTIIQANGYKSILGETAAARAQAAGKTTRWFIERGLDVHGHEIKYRYSKDQGKVYWSGVDYQLEATTPYRNRVEFGYESRPDPVRDYRYGDLEFIASRLKRIEVYQGTRLLRRYTLGYLADSLFSLLATVELEGESGAKMPTLSFGYLGPSLQSGRFTKIEGFSSLAGLDTGRLTLEDVNADGLPDLLNGTASAYTYAENVDGARFASVVPLGSAGSPDRNLDAAGVVLADVDGDGYRDVWYPVGDGRFRYFPGGRVDRGKFLGFGAAQVMNGNGVVSDVTRPEVRLSDLNSDGRTDLLFQRASLGDVWIENQAASGFVQRAIPTLPAGVLLTNGAVEFTDFNGDSVLDLVLREFDAGKHDLRVWYGFGSGRFASTEQVIQAPVAGAKEIFLSDVNRDGQVDLVRVSGSWVAYYLNDGRGSFSVRHGDFQGMPETSRTKKILFADMNGNGSTDVVWLTVDGGLSYLDLMGEPHVGLLARIDNGMGLVTDISYRSSTDYAIEAKLSASPWRTPLPHPVSVVSEVSTRDSMELLGVDAEESRTSYDYREGYYDGREREFRGFARVTVTEWGDQFEDSLVRELSMHVGRALDSGSDEEVLKGKV